MQKALYSINTNMNKQDNIKEVIDEFFLKAKSIYGNAFETFWFYESDICPCCTKRRIDPLNMGKDLAMSLNAFMYRDLQVLIGYLLCSKCVSNLFGNEKLQKKLYQKIEQNLKQAYHKHLETLAS